MGLSFLRTPRWREAQSYYRAYPLLAVVIEIEGPDPEILTQLEELRRVAPQTLAPPLLCVTAAHLSPEERATLAAAGIDAVFGAKDPAHFMLYQFRLLQTMADLRRFEDSKSSVTELAKLTRETLHDLSQPLSAVQGRLQLLAAKCPAEDPNRRYFDDLVRQVFEITNHVIKIQQIQRDAV